MDKAKFQFNNLRLKEDVVFIYLKSSVWMKEFGGAIAATSSRWGPNTRGTNFFGLKFSKTTENIFIYSN